MRVHYLRDPDSITHMGPSVASLVGLPDCGDVDSADLVVLDGWVSRLTSKRNLGRVREWLSSRPWFRGCVDRLVLFDYSDPFEPYGTGWFKAAFRASYNRYRVDPNTFSIPFVFSGDETLKAEPLQCDFSHKVGFVGFGWPPLRRRLAGQVAGAMGADAVLEVHKRYFYQFSSASQRGGVSAFQEALRRCPFSLCPRGAGLGSMRLYESLAWGRIPIVISDGYEMPFGWEVDWDSIVLRVRENEVKRGTAGETIRGLVTDMTTEEMLGRMDKARRAWTDVCCLIHWPRHIQRCLRGLEK